MTGEDGAFLFPNLHEGPYRLTTTASHYAEHELPLALTGEDVKIVLATQGAVKLRVLSADGRPVKAYHLSLKRSFPNNPLAIGNVIGHPDRNINPGDYPRQYGGDWALIDGLPAGDFRFQITERRHAKTLSPEFTVQIGTDPIEVTATLTLGATITGTVIDDRGQPVAGASVTTDMNGGVAANSGLFDVFRSMIPEKHTTKKTTTDGQGRFKIEQLAFADYMIRVAHADYCEGVAINISLQEEGQVVDAGVIQLMKGAIVEGATTVDGQPMGQIKISVAMPLQTAGADAIGALFIFLDLLEGDAERVAKFFLAHAEHGSPQAYPASDMDINRIGLTFFYRHDSGLRTRQRHAVHQFGRSRGSPRSQSRYGSVSAVRPRRRRHCGTAVWVLSRRAQ